MSQPYSGWANKLELTQIKGHSLCFFFRFESHGLVTSDAAVSGGTPSRVPRFCETGPGYPPATVAEVAQTFRQALQNKHKEFPHGFTPILFYTQIKTKKWGNSWFSPP